VTDPHAARQVARLVLWHAVNDKRVKSNEQADRQPERGAILDVEVQVRLARMAAVAASPDELAAPHVLAGADDDAARDEMRQETVFTIGMFDDDEVAAKVGREKVNPAAAGVGRVSHAVAHCDNFSIGGRDDVLAIAEVVSQRTSVAGMPAQRGISDDKIVSVALR
jgi:hypothetical protein